MSASPRGQRPFRVHAPGVLGGNDLEPHAVQHAVRRETGQFVVSGAEVEVDRRLRPGSPEIAVIQVPVQHPGTFDRCPKPDAIAGRLPGQNVDGPFRRMLDRQGVAPCLRRLRPRAVANARVWACVVPASTVDYAVGVAGMLVPPGYTVQVNSDTNDTINVYGWGWNIIGDSQ